MIQVLEAGLQTTLQDSGRPGHLAHGIAPAGAFDTVSYRLANLLVRNSVGSPPLSLGDRGEAALEFVLVGPRLLFQTDAEIAVTGAEFEPTIDGRPIRLWRRTEIRSGAVLAIGAARNGARGYLSIRGGFEAEPWLGSRATYVSAGIGGHHGRALQAGDVLSIDTTPPSGYATETVQSPPHLFATNELRVMAGPQEAMFTESSLAAFYGDDWTMTAAADRMGCRFKGPELQLHPRPAHVVRHGGAGAADIIADVSPLGAIQVPSGLELIALGIEVPSIGGYAKIATLISADIARLAQLRPWQAVRFIRIDLSEAEVAYEQQEGLIRRAEAGANSARPEVVDPVSPPL